MKINMKPIYFAIYYFQKEAIMFFMKSFWNENTIIQYPKMYTTTLDQQKNPYATIFCIQHKNSSMEPFPQ